MALNPKCMNDMDFVHSMIGNVEDLVRELGRELSSERRNYIETTLLPEARERVDVWINKLVDCELDQMYEHTFAPSL